MNTPHNDDNGNDLRYAEYVLGVLEADARAAVEREIAQGDAAAVAVALWQRRLFPLVDSLPEAEPPARVWRDIVNALKLSSTPREAERRATGWDNLRLWRWIGIAASGLATACLVMILRAPVTPISHGVLMVASIRQANGVADWTATMDLDRKQIVVVPATSTSIASNRSTQLWLIPRGQKPISVGVFNAVAPSVLPLTAALLAQLGPDAALAVSVEPLGGSPTAQPTGPVIATGAISGASGPSA